MSAAIRQPPTGPRDSTVDRDGGGVECFFPVPDTDERIEIIATLVFTKYQETDFGSTWKGLFLCEGELGRFKLWGTIPSGLEEEIEKLKSPATIKGSLVTFWARVQRGKRDDFSGFFTRPTKAHILVSGINGKEQ
jgi:hypothetical protein